jgi:hypothetical protein
MCQKHQAKLEQVVQECRAEATDATLMLVELRTLLGLPPEQSHVVARDRSLVLAVAGLLQDACSAHNAVARLPFPSESETQHSRQPRQMHAPMGNDPWSNLGGGRPEIPVPTPYSWVHNLELVKQQLEWGGAPSIVAASESGAQLEESSTDPGLSLDCSIFFALLRREP